MSSSAKKKTTMFDFFSKKPAAAPKTTTTVVATPRDKIRVQTPKTPATAASTDAEPSPNDFVGKKVSLKKRKAILEDSSDEDEKPEPKQTLKKTKTPRKEEAKKEKKAPKKEEAKKAKKAPRKEDAKKEKKAPKKEEAKKAKKAPRKEEAKKKPIADTPMAKVEDEKKEEEKEKIHPPAAKEKKVAPAAERKKPVVAPEKKPSNGMATGWGFLNGDRSFKKQETKKKRKSTTGNNSDNNTNKIVKEPYQAGDDLPILVHPQDMFDDMIHNQLCENGTRLDLLQPLLEKLHGRTLKIATMCSGTESPVLALDMIGKALEDVCQQYDIKVADGQVPQIQLEHVFSCEIEPFKQSYIERNFAPKRLFRDIRELGNDQATTAFGALIDVPNSPGCVDLLVAGTSCVDYSNLNNKKKTLEEEGESGQTFQGMLKWIEKAQPAIIILENVCGAPWELKVKLMEEYGYAATFARVDTKNFYIPHTRQRGYLFAVRKDKQSMVNQKRIEGWQENLKKFKRPASATLDDFMLNNDDPRVLRGRARLVQESSIGNSGESRAMKTDWSKCETRHQMARSVEALGDKRPMTGWSERGTFLPGFAWNEWMKAQVNRVHDLVDINTLRLAQNDVDNTYKTMIWNLSQNVDRDTMGRFGLSQCLTPTGLPYVTNRGGPLVGEELLSLQGIPADDLLFTKESEANLKDLAGNAMSSTVVGACILGGLLQGYKALPTQTPSKNVGHGGSIVSSLVPRPLGPASEVKITQAFGEYKDTVLDLGQPACAEKEYLSKLLAEGWLSSRFCVTESPDEARPDILQCSKCGQTSSFEAASPTRKYEEHHFQPVENLNRIHPPVYRRKLLDALPMILKIQNLDIQSLTKPEGINDKLWNEWQKRVDESARSVFRFAQLDRRHYWVATFRSSSGSSHLELRLHKSHCEWLLFAEAPCKRGVLRDFLERPVARFHVPRSSDSLLAANCELRLPVVTKMELTITADGAQVQSWRQRLGLKAEFEKETQAERLKVLLNTDDEGIKSKIDGVYEYLPSCGGACGSMHKRIHDGTTHEEPVFFFFESSRGGLPTSDSYVFSEAAHRTSYGEHRETLLMIDPKADFRPVSTKMKEPTVVLQAHVPGTWVQLSKTSVQQVEESSRKASCSVPSSALTVPLCQDGWKSCPELASFDVPMNETDEIFQRCMRAKAPLDLNLRKSKRLLQDLAFVLSRVTIPVAEGRNAEDWMKLDNEEDLVCKKCAPSRPHVRWQLVSVGKKREYKPIEDWQEAAGYEAELKSRPAPWNLRLTHTGSDKSIRAQLGLNAFSLCQRAFGLFPPSIVRQEMIQTSPEKSKCCLEWRVVPHSEKVGASFEKLTFTSNKRDPEAEQPPNFHKFKLRKEQLRSLSWMLEQERGTQPFNEEEVCEAVLPSLDWRAEGRVQRPVLVRGGVIADEVGYGKTCITLALIDANSENESSVPEPHDSFIGTKATLVVVPGHLMGQWPKEVNKFLGTSKKVVVVKDMSSFNKLTVSEVEKADIVIVNFTVLCGDKYFARLCRFSGKNPKSMPSGQKGGRHFDAVYGSCLDCIPARVEQLKNDCASTFAGIESDAKECQKQDESEESSLRLDGKKAVYKSTGKDGKSGKNETSNTGGWKLDAKEVDPWKLKGEKDYTKMKCPPLELFQWRRVVVDEFTYLMDKADRQRSFSVVKRLSSEYRWFLSGTPKHETFDDIKCLAKLLNVHLGIDELLPGAKVGKGRGNESTAAETMSQFLEVRSLQWHERRLGKAQEFLDKFVRQNIAEIDEIPGVEEEIVVDLSPVERAIYLELETYLRSLEMNAQSAKMSKKKSQSDRENRMQKVLQESNSAEEALLKCCTHFNLSGESTTALKTLKNIIQFRKDQKKELEAEIVSSVAAAIRQQDRIEKEQPGWKTLAKEETGEVLNPVGHYLQLVEDSKSILHGADADIHKLVKELVAMAKKEASENPDADDAVFGDVNNRLAAIKDADQPSKKRKVSAAASTADDEPSRKEIMFEMKKTLRDHVHRLNALGKELCGRVRSLRYVESMRRLQQGASSIQCEGCNGATVSPSEVGILSICGHMGRLECLKKHAANENCVVPSCEARVNVAHVVAPSQLGVDADENVDNADGAKLSAMIKKVQEILSREERLIIFVQFDDLKDRIAQTLASHNILAVQVKGGVQQQEKALLPFQEETPKKGDPRVLLLKMDDEQSAGLNLIYLNHVLFAHPLLAASQQEYDAYETQAIGRVRRYGQSKTVFVWRFLVKDSIDTAIYEEKGGRLLSATTVNQRT